MSAWSTLVLKMRKEPAVTLLCGAASLLLLAATVVLLVQVLVREAPIKDPSGILPPPARPQPTPIRPTSILPVGTVVAFFGEDRDVPKTWAICDGRDNPKDSEITLDANREKPGIQLPSLGHKFIRGSKSSLQTGLTQGGIDNVHVSHSHQWAEFTGEQWRSFDKEGQAGRVDDWNDGVGDQGSGNRPLSNDSAMTLFTDIRGESMDNRPAHVELRYIIKVR